MRALLPQLSKIAIFNKSGEPSFEEHALCFSEHPLYKFTSFFNDILPTHKWKVQSIKYSTALWHISSLSQYGQYILNMSAKNLVCIAKSLVDLDQRIFAHSNIPMELKIAKGRRIGLGSCAPTVFGSRSQFLLQYSNLQAVKMETHQY